MRAITAEAKRTGLPLGSAAVALAIGAGAVAFAHGIGVPATQAAPFVIAALSVPLIALHRTGAARLGWANTVTLVRLTLAAILLAAVPELADAGPPAWLVAAMGGVALALDGVDGWLARRLDEVSAFGARLDMEADTVLLFACTLAVVALDGAGLWVVAAALLRPAFVVVGRYAPWLRAPLPPSARRKLFCAVPIALLVAAMLGGPAAVVLAALALAMLALSFAIDIVWLWHRRTHNRDGLTAS